METSIVSLAFILPYVIDGIKFLSLARANLNVASLFPGLVSFMTSLVDISNDCSSKVNLMLVLSLSIHTGTHLAVTVMSNSCWSFMIYLTVPRKSPKVSLQNKT